MGTFNRVLSDEQRLAVQQAYGDRNIRPIRRIVELAAAGDLTADSAPVDAFALKASTAADIGRRYVARRRGTSSSALADAPDALEIIRRRLVGAVDHALTEIERRQAKPMRAGRPHVGGAELQALAKAARELAALPTATAPAAAPAPNNRAPDAPRRSAGLGAQILRAGGARRTLEETAPGARAVAEPILQTSELEPAARAHAHERTPAELGDVETGDALEPGTYIRSRLASLGAK